MELKTLDSTQLTLVCNFFPFKPDSKLPLGSRDSYVIGRVFFSGSCATYAEKAAFVTSHSMMSRNPDVAVFFKTPQWKGFVEGTVLDLESVQKSVAHCLVKPHAILRIEGRSPRSSMYMKGKLIVAIIARFKALMTMDGSFVWNTSAGWVTTCVDSLVAPNGFVFMAGISIRS